MSEPAHRTWDTPQPGPCQQCSEPCSLSMAWQECSGRVCSQGWEKGLFPSTAPGHAPGRGCAPPFRDGWMKPGFQAAPQGSHPAPQAGETPLYHPSGCCLVKWEVKKHQRSASMGLLISLEQSPLSSSGIISLKDTNQHKTASCSAPSATWGLGAGRPRLLTAFARQTWL